MPRAWRAPTPCGRFLTVSGINQATALEGIGTIRLSFGELERTKPRARPWGRMSRLSIAPKARFLLGKAEGRSPSVNCVNYVVCYGFRKAMQIRAIRCGWVPKRPNFGSETAKRIFRKCGFPIGQTCSLYQEPVGKFLMGQTLGS
jgi:hypothetical protein